jgi:hypothetical protein
MLLQSIYNCCLILEQISVTDLYWWLLMSRRKPGIFKKTLVHCAVAVPVIVKISMVE